MNRFDPSNGEAEAATARATSLAYAAIGLQARIFEARDHPGINLSLDELQALAQPLVGQVVEGQYEQRSYYRDHQGLFVTRTVPFGRTLGSVPVEEDNFETNKIKPVGFIGLLAEMTEIRRTQVRKNDVGLGLDPLGSDEAIASFYSRLGRNKLHHPLGVYRFDTDKRIWLSVRAITRLVSVPSHLYRAPNAKSMLARHIKSKYPSSEE